MGAFGIAIALAAILAWRHFAHRPSSSAFAAWLNQNARGSVLFEHVDAKLKPQSDGLILAKITATGAIPEPLYTSISASQLLRQLDFDVTPLQETQSALSSPDAPELIALAGSPPADPLAHTYLVQVTPADKPITYTGMVAARRNGDGWSFEYLSRPFTLDDSLGQPRSHFPAGSRLGDDPKISDALRQAAHARADYAVRLDSAQTQLLQLKEKKRAEEIAREQEALAVRAKQQRMEHEARLALFQGFLKPGTLFDGHIQHRTDAFNRHRILLEIVSVHPTTRQVSAVLRNDGSWRDARPFEGSWDVGAGSPSARVLLSSPSSKRMESAGPILAEYNLQFAFSLSPEGRLSATTESYDLDLAHLAKPAAEAVKTEVTAAFNAALAATLPDTTYHGLVVSTTTNTTENVLLRFTRQEHDGTVLTATIEPLLRPNLKRTFRGVLVESRHQGADEPVRLRLSGEDRIQPLPDSSFFGHRYSRDFSFRIDGDQLIAAEAYFSIRLTRATEESSAALARQQAGIEERFHSLVKKGALYDGLVSHPDNAASRIRIHILDTNVSLGTVSASIISREQPGIHHRMNGTFDVWDGTLTLGTAAGGTFNPSGILRVPIFSSDRSYRIVLRLGENSFTGTIAEYEKWRFDFPILPADLSAGAVAGYPTQPGVYLKSGDTWILLPANGGRPDEGAGAIAKQLLGTLTNPNAAQNGEKLTDLLFDGTDPVPSVDGGSVVIAYRGMLKDPPPGVPADYPPMEIGASRTDATGKRRAPLLRIAPFVAGFMETRIPATVEKLDSDLHLLTVIGPLAPGTYALMADKAVEFQIH